MSVTAKHHAARLRQRRLLSSYEFHVHDPMLLEWSYSQLPFAQRKLLHMAAAKWHMRKCTKTQSLFNIPHVVQHLCMAEEEGRAIAQLQVLLSVEKWGLRHCHFRLKRRKCRLALFLLSLILTPP